MPDGWTNSTVYRVSLCENNIKKRYAVTLKDDFCFLKISCNTYCGNLNLDHHVYSGLKVRANIELFLVSESLVEWDLPRCFEVDSVKEDEPDVAREGGGRHQLGDQAPGLLFHPIVDLLRTL